MPLFEKAYPEELVQEGAYLDFNTRCKQHYEGRAYNSDVYHSLRTDPRFLALSRESVVSGMTAGTVDASMLAAWVLWRSDEADPTIALADLERYLENDNVEVFVTLWVQGIEVDLPTELPNGMKLVPIENMPKSSEKEFFSIPVFYSFLNPRCAITKKISVTKISTIESRNLVVETQKQLRDIALLINALPSVSCVAAYEEYYSEEGFPYGPLATSAAGLPLPEIPAPSVTKLEPHHIAELFTLELSYRLLNAKEKDRMEVVLSRISQAKRSARIEAKLLDTCIALEMLLLNGITNKISRTFRERGSNLIGVSQEDRNSKAKLLKELYDFRSNIAHSGIVSEKNIQLKELVITYSESMALAENVFRRILGGPKPDWILTAPGATS